MPTDLLDILRALLDAAFKTGGLADSAHAELSAKLEAHARGPEPEPEPEPGPSGPVVTRAPARPAGL